MWSSNSICGAAKTEYWAPESVKMAEGSVVTTNLVCRGYSISLNSIPGGPAHGRSIIWQSGKRIAIVICERGRVVSVARFWANRATVFYCGDAVWPLITVTRGSGGQKVTAEFDGHRPEITALKITWTGGLCTVKTRHARYIVRGVTLPVIQNIEHAREWYYDNWPLFVAAVPEFVKYAAVAARPFLALDGIEKIFPKIRGTDLADQTSRRA